MPLRTAAARSKAVAEAAIDAGFAEIRAIEKSFSLFDPASELSRLNRLARLESPSPRFLDVARRSGELWRDAEGAFDASVQPLWNSVDDAAPIGWKHVSVSARGIGLQPGMALTFNGIAQGYAADRVLHAMKACGGASVTCDTGAIGVEDASVFAIRHPRAPDQSIARLAIASGFIATSGDYATAFMVMGREKSLAYCMAHPGVAALLITKGVAVIASPAMKPLLLA